MRVPSVPLALLKFSAAVAITGSAALLAFRRLHHERALASLRRDIRAALFPLLQDIRRQPGGNPGPPAVLVMGFHAQGKSSFVNTACRALTAESGMLIHRAHATTTRHVVRAAVAPDGGGGRGEEVEEMVVELVDSQPLPLDAGTLKHADVETALAQSTAECVVVVLSCSPAKERSAALKALPDIASVLHNRGLNFVVVLTHKKALRSKKRAQEMRKEVATRARTDCIFFIENYTTNSSVNVYYPTVINNDFETHFTALAIIRQCIEFVRLYRTHSLDNPSVTPAANNRSLAGKQ